MTERYVVSRMNGCIVIEGRIPVTDLVGLMKAWDDPALIVDSLLSAHLKCNMVIGPPEACQAWRDRLGIVPEAPPVEGQPVKAGKPYRNFECFLCGTQQQSGASGEMYCDACDHVSKLRKGEPRYKLVTEGKHQGIQCRQCRMTSFNANDIRNRYCGNCAEFLEDDQ